jgi:hypothetical protein
MEAALARSDRNRIPPALITAGLTIAAWAR